MVAVFFAVTLLIGAFFGTVFVAATLFLEAAFLTVDFFFEVDFLAGVMVFFFDAAFLAAGRFLEVFFLAAEALDTFFATGRASLSVQRNRCGYVRPTHKC